MNFRLIWMGSDEDPDKHLPVGQPSIAAPRIPPSSVQYERQGSALVRRRQLPDGRLKFTTLTNFTARIVRDMVLDDDAERRRLFEVEDLRR